MQEERPSTAKKWRNAYALVIGALILLIIFFYFFTKQFA
jgi:hypothetical protein